MSKLFDDADMADLTEMFNELGGNEGVGKQGAFEKTPDGTYEAEIIKVEGKKNKDGIRAIAITLGLDGIDRPHTAWLNLGHKNPQYNGFILSNSIKALQSLGVLDAKTIEEYLDGAANLVGTECIITLKTNDKGFQNTEFILK